MSNAVRANRQRGVTLLELMIVVVVLGILVSIAYPSYQQYVIKTNRSTAMSYLSELASKQEEFVLDARRYASGTTELGASVPGEVSKYYTITVTAYNASTPPAYTLLATPITGGMQAADGSLTLKSSGEKLPADKWQ